MSYLFSCSVTMVSKCPQGSISIPKGSRWKRGWERTEGGFTKKRFIRRGIFRKGFFREGFTREGCIRMGFIRKEFMKESFFSGEGFIRRGFLERGYQKGFFQRRFFREQDSERGVSWIIYDKLKQFWRLMIFCVFVGFHDTYGHLIYSLELGRSVASFSMDARGKFLNIVH